MNIAEAGCVIRWPVFHNVSNRMLESRTMIDTVPTMWAEELRSKDTVALVATAAAPTKERLESTMLPGIRV